MARIFFTGFPGFLGRELLPRVLKRTPKAVATCLVQSRYRADAERAIAGLGDAKLAERIELVDGDITRPDLGLGAQRDGLAKDTIEVYHLAAVYDLSVGRDLAVKINVDGTRHVLDFCAKADNLKRHQYVSTCYVSGRYAGIFTEDDLDKNQPFNNFYEETKHLAEREVRARMGEIPTTIYRPSVVAGDAPTGATQKYDGPYFILRWLLKQPGNVALVPMVGDPTAVRFNVVPRDFVVDALTYLSGEEKSAGQCYALADPAPMTVEEIIGAMETATGKRLIRIPLTVDIAKAAIDYVPGVQKLLGIPSSAVDYFVHPTHYLTTNASRDLAGSGLSVPPFASYLDNMVAFVRANPTISSDAMI